MDSVDRAATLLRAAAEFFRSVGEPGTPLADQMTTNADVYEAVAAELDREGAKLATANGSRAAESVMTGSDTPIPAPRPQAPAPAETDSAPLLLDRPVPAQPGHPGTSAATNNRRYLVKCWREGANKNGPPDFEFLIADAANGEEAISKGRLRAEQMVRASGREDQFYCRAQRY